MLVKINSKNINCYRNLSQNYEAEFSPLTGKLPNSKGLYEITELDKTHEGYIYYDCDRPIGFVVVDTGREIFDIAEFYIVPSHRRKGTGKIIASQIFDLYQGNWQVRQIKGADIAYSFWITTICEYTKGNFTDTIELDTEWGIVRIQKFRTST